MKRKNVTLSLLVAGACVAGIVCLPLPYHVDCAVEIQPRDAEQVFAMVPGRLVAWKKRPGEVVNVNDIIAELDSPELRTKLLEQKSEYEMAVERYQTLRERLNYDEQARVQLTLQEQIVRSSAEMLHKIQERAKQLNIVAKSSGVIIAPPNKPEPKKAELEEQLPGWSGNPFDESNQEAFFTESDLICLVGVPNSWDAMLVVDQHDIDLINLNVEVDILVESARLDKFSGRIDRISEMEMKISPESLSLQSGGRLDTEMDESGRLRPISTSYQARVRLEDVEVPLRAGYRGQAKVYVGWKTVGWRIYRFCAKTFSFDM